MEANVVPTISLVIPVFNGEPWLRETLNSVCQQTLDHGDFEIVVVDDGSTDDSRRISSEVLKRNSIRHSVLSQENGGPSKARNAGWHHSSGEWIQFLDSDDLLSRRKLEVQRRWTESTSPDVAVIYSDWQRLEASHGRWELAGEVVRPVIGNDSVCDLLSAANVLLLGSQLIHRGWLEKVGGFDERHWLIEDIDLLLRIAMAGGAFRHARSEEPLYYYRQRGRESLSQRSRRDFVDGCVRNAEMVEEVWRSRDELTVGRARQLAEVYAGGSRYFAACDIPRFNLLVQRIEGLVPGFTPAKPRRLRQLSRILGYRRAELLSVQYRRAKAIFVGGLANRIESPSAKPVLPARTA